MTGATTAAPWSTADPVLPHPLPQRATPCLQRLTRSRDWSPTVALEVAGLLIGVRSSSPSVSRVVEERFTRVRAPGRDDDVPAHFSVVLAEDPTDARVRPLNLVHRDHMVVARRRDPEDLLCDLVELVEASTLSRSVEHLAVHASVVVGSDGRALLLPRQWHRMLTPRQRPLSRLGLRLLPASTQLVDTARCHVVVPDLGTAVRRRAPERFPVAGWVVSGAFGSARVVSPARGVAAALAGGANLHQGSASWTLQQLADLAERIPFIALDRCPAPAHIASLFGTRPHGQPAAGGGTPST